jgi:hypothetical protein
LLIENQNRVTAGLRSLQRLLRFYREHAAAARAARDRGELAEYRKRHTQAQDAAQAYQKLRPKVAAAMPLLGKVRCEDWIAWVEDGPDGPVLTVIDLARSVIDLTAEKSVGFWQGT